VSFRGSFVSSGSESSYVVAVETVSPSLIAQHNPKLKPGENEKLSFHTVSKAGSVNESSKWKTENGKREMRNEKWKMRNGKSKLRIEN
jgi:hypothetical protein